MDIHIANYTLVGDASETSITTTVCPCYEQIGDPPTPLVAVVGGFSHPVDAECGEVEVFTSPFIRADCNGDEAPDIADAIYTARFLFASGTPGPCQDACDSNDDGNIDIGDIIYTLNHLFGGKSAPPAPYPKCGGDPTPDLLDCAFAYPACP